MNPSRANTSRARRMLIGCYFLRPVVLEGVGTFVAGLAEGMAGCGWAVTLVCPAGSIIPRHWSNMPISVVTYRPGLAGIRRYAEILGRESALHDIALMVENNPNAMYISDIVRNTSGVVTYYYFYTPLLGVGALGELGWRRQAWLHTAAKLRFWAALRDWKDSRFIVASEYQRSQLRQLGATSVRIVPGSVIQRETPVANGSRARRHIRCRKVRLREKLGIGDGFVVGYLGHFSPAKGVGYLLDAFSIAAGCENMTLLLAHSGKGNLDGRHRQMLNHLAERGLARISHIVEPQEFLGACDVSVLPYPSPSVHHPPLVLVESMAACTPVITTDVGGIAEFVEHGRTGFVAPPRNAEAISDYLVMLAGNPGRASDMALAARLKFEKQFCREIFCRQLNGIFLGEELT